MSSRVAGFLCTLFLVLAAYFLLAISVIFDSRSKPIGSEADQALASLLKVLAGACGLCVLFFGAAWFEAAYTARRAEFLKPSGRLEDGPGGTTTTS